MRLLYLVRRKTCLQAEYCGGRRGEIEKQEQRIQEGRRIYVSKDTDRFMIALAAFSVELT